MHFHKWTTWAKTNDAKLRYPDGTVMKEVEVWRKQCQACHLPKYKQITVGSV